MGFKTFYPSIPIISPFSSEFVSSSISWFFLWHGQSSQCCSMFLLADASHLSQLAHMRSIILHQDKFLSLQIKALLHNANCFDATFSPRHILLLNGNKVIRNIFFKASRWLLRCFSLYYRFFQFVDLGLTMICFWWCSFLFRFRCT